MSDTLCMDLSHISIAGPQSALIPRECPVVSRLECANGLWSVDASGGMDSWSKRMDRRP